MTRTRVALVTLVLVVTLARHGAAQVCDAAARQAERAWDLPAGLLSAVGRVEAGDAAVGRGAWPWSVNDGGTGHVFADAGSAIAYVTARTAAGGRFIDVGCFQIDLSYHPAAFTGVAEAFDAGRNAEVAASFLASLHAELGSWDDAVAAYHSRNPALGAPYRERVMAAWRRPGAADAGPGTPVVPAVVRNVPPAVAGLPRIIRLGGAFEAAAQAAGHLPKIQRGA